MQKNPQKRSNVLVKAGVAAAPSNSSFHLFPVKQRSHVTFQDDVAQTITATHSQQQLTEEIQLI